MTLTLSFLVYEILTQSGGIEQNALMCSPIEISFVKMVDVTYERSRAQ